MLAINSLVLLRLGEVFALSDIPGDGQYMLSRVEPYMHDLNIRYIILVSVVLWLILCDSLALGCLNFSRNGRFANPSRLDPALVTCRPADNSFVTFKDRTADTIIFVSTVIVNESYVASPKRFGTAGQMKYISGIFHAVEWERACSFFCMALSADRLVGQVRSLH